MITCPYCDSTHGDLLLCPPAKRVLDALLEQGMSFDMPTIEFPEPVTGAGVFGGSTVLVGQFVTKAAIIPVAGVPRPTLIFTGRDITGAVLPEWIYPGEPEAIRRASKLVSDMAEMSIRRARQEAANQGGKPR